MTNSPKTARLVRLAGTDANIRLTAADRAFLQDLSRVQLISSDLADQYHYHHLKGLSARSLARLEQAGLLSSKPLRQAGASTIRIYQFADKTIAGAFGGKLPVTGAKRTDLHELMSARTYFALGRPATFRLAANFTRAEIAFCGSMRPDALYVDTSTGEMVAVEADSGQYTRSQINSKIAQWRRAGVTRQVWAQPKYARSALLPDSPDIRVMRL